MEKLTWLPIYIDSLLSSPAWMDMRDYQRGWYFQLLLRSTRSERLGYLPLDQRLWKLAGAHRREQWDRDCSAVMACFKIRTFEAQDWIYNERLLSVMEEQSGKYYRKKDGASNSPVSHEVVSLDNSVNCKRHPEANRTPKGRCWDCYVEEVESHTVRA